MNIMDIPEQGIRATLDFFRRTLDRNFFEAQEEHFERAAGWGAPISAALGLLLAVIAAIKIDSFKMFLLGIAWVFLVCVGYFIGRQFVLACRKMIRNNPSTISSGAFLESVGLLMIITLAAVVLGAVYAAIEASSATPLFVGWFAAVALAYSISMLLNPSIISTTVTVDSTAGDDALSIMVVFYKIAVRLTGIAFGGSLILGALLLSVSIFNLLNGDLAEVIGGGLQSLSGVMFTLGGLVYPFVIYITFVFFYLFIDICRAILSLHNRQTPSSAPPQEDEAPRESGPGMSPEIMKRVLLVALAVLVATFAAVKGKQYYDEYQARAEMERLQEEQAKAAEEQARQEEAARVAEEQARLQAEAAAKAAQAAFAAQVRPYVGKSSLDLVRATGVNELFRGIFAENYNAFETYLRSPQAVIEAEGFLIGPGCGVEGCGTYQGIAVVDLAQQKAFAVLSTNGNPGYYGIELAELPAPVANWISTHW